MKKTPFLLCLLLSHSLANAALLPLTFNLTMDANRAEIGHLTANTASLGGFTMLEPRTFANNKAVSIRCINNNKTTVVVYRKQIQCEKIQWSVNFVSADDLDQNVSNQNNLVSKQGWWVLFEWDVLPRIKEVAQINLCVDQANNTAKGCWQLPDASQPPLIAVWGKPAVSFNTVDNSYHLYSSSHSAPLFIKDNIAGLKAQYDYLSNLFAASEKSNKSMNIVWIGIDKAHGALGGAAGVNAYVANHGVENGSSISAASQERLLWISGHETFHMLSPYHYPLWISESLAQYYGYQSVAQAQVMQVNPMSDWVEKKQRMPFAEVGLHVAHQKVNKEHDMRYYGLFYIKGAAFWQALDTQLQAHKQSLDKFLALLSGTSDNNGRLPVKFVKAIETVIGKSAFQALAQEYLD